VNGTNVGAGLIGLSLSVEVDGLQSDIVTIPVQSMTPGGVLNPVRSTSEKVLQAPDRIEFVMRPGRGQGLTFWLVVRDQLRFVT
jgi:hypothetical protein